MKQFVRITLMLVCLACFAGITAWALVSESGQLLSVPLLQDRGASITETRSERLERFPGDLTVAGVPTAYDRVSRTYYVSQTLTNDELEGMLGWSEPGVSVAIVANDELQDKANAIATGYPFKILIYDDTSYRTAKLVFTGMPIVTLQDEQTTEVVGENYGVLYTGTFRLFDPEGRSGDGSNQGMATHRYSVVESTATYHARGMTSMNFPKTSLRIELLDENGLNNNQQLLTMRLDDDWILMSLYNDCSKIRDKMSIDLWNDFAADNEENPVGTHMEYVEVFWNDTYVGLYGLMEPLDQKTANLTEEDRLFNTTDWYLPSFSELLVSRKQMEGRSFEIKWPKEWPGSDVWIPVRTYLDMFHHNPKLYGSDVQQRSVKVSNFIDFGMFVNATTAVDNTFKNNYFIAEAVANDYGTSYLFSKMPWDMNYTWGECWTDQNKNYTYFRTDQLKANYMPNDLRYMYVLDPETIGPMLVERWEELRETICDEERLITRMQEMNAFLHASGAWARDSARWPDSLNKDDLQIMADFLHERLEFLDQLYTGLTPNNVWIMYR